MCSSKQDGSLAGSLSIKYTGFLEGLGTDFNTCSIKHRYDPF